IGLLGLALTYRNLKGRPIRDSWWRGLNWPSLIAIGVFCFTAMVGLNLPLEAGYGWTHPIVIALLIASPILLILFVVVDAKQSRPLIPYRALKNRVFTWSVASGAVSMILVFSVIYLINFQMQRINGFEKQLTGFVLVTSPIALSTWGPLSGWVSDRFGARLPRLLGICCSGAAVLWMGTLNAADGPWQVVARLALFATGMGLFQTPNNKITYDAIPQDVMAHVSSFNACIRMFCTALGTASVTAVLGQSLRFYLDGDPPSVEALVATPATEAAFQATFTSMIVAAALVFLFALMADRAARMQGLAS
ncbi:MAG: MFS transporter, partial [Planctomycetes bacterium]|nr:MFS transporter [Planctomycetota bacterium]